MTEARPTGPFTEEERYRFDLQGFLVRRNALNGPELADARQAVDALKFPPPGPELGTQRFRDYVHTAPIFANLIDHPAVIDILIELCGPHVRLDHHYGITMAPGTSGLWIHGGATPFDPSQYYLVANNEIHSGLVSVAWNLVDAPPGMGGFTCIPGSHKASFALPQSIDYGHDVVIDVSLNAGDVLFFTEALTHGTSTWRSNEERRLLFYKYSPGNSAWGYETTGGIPESMFAKMTDRQRRLCQPPRVYNHEPIEG